CSQSSLQSGDSSSSSHVVDLLNHFDHFRLPPRKTWFPFTFSPQFLHSCTVHFTQKLHLGTVKAAPGHGLSLHPRTVKSAPPHATFHRASDRLNSVQMQEA